MKKPTYEDLEQRISAVREHFGDKLLLLGHHYQQDEVIKHSDLRGDSYQLSEMAASSSDCRYIVFCGVHFMAETADMLANRPEKLAERDGERVTVVLPDMAAGCSMADMAEIDQVQAAWDDMGELIVSMNNGPPSLATVDFGSGFSKYVVLDRHDHQLHQRRARDRVRPTQLGRGNRCSRQSWCRVRCKLDSRSHSASTIRPMRQLSKPVSAMMRWMLSA